MALSGLRACVYSPTILDLFTQSTLSPCSAVMLELEAVSEIYGVWEHFLQVVVSSLYQRTEPHGSLHPYFRTKDRRC